MQEGGCLLKPRRGFGPPTPPTTPSPAHVVPTCSRRFCQRPHGLSSRMSLSSSLSSSLSRSRPRLGAGSGAAMARRAQAAALRAIRRCRRPPWPRAQKPSQERSRRRLEPRPGLRESGGAGARPERWSLPAPPEPPPRTRAGVELPRVGLIPRGGGRRPRLSASTARPASPRPRATPDQGPRPTEAPAPLRPRPSPSRAKARPTTPVPRLPPGEPPTLIPARQSSAPC